MCQLLKLLFRDIYCSNEYGMEIFYLTKIIEVQINDTINKYIMNMSGDYT